MIATNIFLPCACVVLNKKAKQFIRHILWFLEILLMMFHVGISLNH